MTSAGLVYNNYHVAKNEHPQKLHKCSSVIYQGDCFGDLKIIQSTALAPQAVLIRYHHTLSYSESDVMYDVFRCCIEFFKK